MSILEQLGAQLRATADELPLDAVALAVERLRLATDLLAWVRQSSASPIGVPVLAGATEHLEQAAYALRAGQDSIGEYLTAIGLAYQSTAPPDTTWRKAVADAERQARPEAAEVEPSPLDRWWEGRVNYLAEHTGADDPESRDKPDRGGLDPKAAAREVARDSAQLLRQAAKQVLADDRKRLRRELARVEPPVGLGLSALTPPVLRQLATELLGHQPGPKDLERLQAETGEQIRRLMPKMPDHVVAEQLARVCRVPPAKSSGKDPAAAAGKDAGGSPGETSGKEPGKPQEEPTHPTDAAVAGAVLTGLLLRRLKRDPETLRPPDESADQPDAPAGQPAGKLSGGHG